MAQNPDPVLENRESKAKPHSPTIRPSSSQTLEQDPNTVQSPSPKGGTGSSVSHSTEDDESPPIEDSDAPLEDYDWAGLEERFHAKMEECGRAEQKLYDEFSNCVRVRRYGFPQVELNTDFPKLFEAWALVTTSYDNYRYHKRYYKFQDAASVSNTFAD